MDKPEIVKKTNKDLMEKYAVENTFSADQLIDAWSKGVQQGTGIPDFLNETFSLLRNSTSIILDFYNKNLTKANCFSVFMKVLPHKVNFIATIDKDVYLDDDACRPVYLESAKITQKNPFISISFIPCTDDKSVNVSALNADNYVKIM
jgi:hypothetical protein